MPMHKRDDVWMEIIEHRLTQRGKPTKNWPVFGRSVAGVFSVALRRKKRIAGDPRPRHAKKPLEKVVLLIGVLLYIHPESCGNPIEGVGRLRRAQTYF